MGTYTYTRSYGKMLPEYTIVIPTFGEKGLVLLKNMLPVLSYSCHLPHEIIVVDDGSTEEVVRELDLLCKMHSALLLHDDENRGFARACNAGILHSNGNSVILCNNDIIPIGDTFDQLSDDVKLYGVGLVGCKLIYPDNRIQHAGVYYQSPTSGSGHGWFDHLRRFQPRNDFIASRMEFRLCTGALLAINGELIKMVGPLDERFQMACEDIDLNMRCLEAGMMVIYDGHIEAYHLEGVTRGNTHEEKDKHPEWVQKEQDGLDLFFDKWAGVSFSMFAVQYHD